MKEYSYSDILIDVLNYFVKKENINVLQDSKRLEEVCNTVRMGKRYSINGYRLDITALIYALIENSVAMYDITKNYVSDLSKKEYDFSSIQDCNEVSKELYNQDELEKLFDLLLNNHDYFDSLVKQFIETKVIRPIVKKEETEVLKQVAKKSDYIKQLEKEEERYRYLRTAIVQTSQRHGNQAARKGFLYYVDNGDAKALSNATCRLKLNSYSNLDLKTILFDYIVREYSMLEKNDICDKQEFIDCMKTNPEEIYGFEIPEEWYIEYVNDMINGLYEEVDKSNLTYQSLMQTVFATYQKENQRKKR